MIVRRQAVILCKTMAVGCCFQIISQGSAHREGQRVQWEGQLSPRSQRRDMGHPAVEVYLP
jgi:hypothetical protein